MAGAVAAGLLLTNRKWGIPATVVALVQRRPSAVSPLIEG
jgi:hypothetical protein